MSSQPVIARAVPTSNATSSVAKDGAPAQATVGIVPEPAGAAPSAMAMQPLRGPSCVGSVNEGPSVIVPVGKSTLVPLDEPARARTLGNPAVAQATLVSPHTLYLVGMSVGTTNMIIQGQSGACEVIDVIVNIDANGLQEALTDLLPEERAIRASTAGGNLVLGGRVSSAPVAQQAMEIAKAYAASGGGAAGAAKADVINMMTVDSPQQVMLEVKVAEVAKTLIDELGSQVNLAGGFGSWTAFMATQFLTNTAPLLAGMKSNKFPLSIAANAQKTDDLTKILAEPNLVAVSGQEASFLAGGKIFIPVPQAGAGGTNIITLQEEEFGVGLKFTPTVLSNGRINLKVAPEVSELSPTGVTVSARGTSAVSILPLITTRRASTTVQLNDGESFAIGGLIRNNVTGALKALPGLGELPIIGALLRSTSFQQDRTELVFVITPHLVKPLANSNYPLPTDSFTQPNVIDVYATGDMEGRGAQRGTRSAPPAPAPGAAAPASTSTQSVAAPAGTSTQPPLAPASSVTRPAAEVPPPATSSSPAEAQPVPVPTANINTALLPREESGKPATRDTAATGLATPPATADAARTDEPAAHISTVSSERTGN